MSPDELRAEADKHGYSLISHEAVKTWHRYYSWYPQVERMLKKELDRLTIKKELEDIAKKPSPK